LGIGDTSDGAVVRHKRNRRAGAARRGLRLPRKGPNDAPLARLTGKEKPRDAAGRHQIVVLSLRALRGDEAAGGGIASES